MLPKEFEWSTLDLANPVEVGISLPPLPPILINVILVVERSVRVVVRQLRRGQRRCVPVPILGRVPHLARAISCFPLFLRIDNFLTIHRAMMPPGYHPEWHLGVRVKSTKKLVAFIAGVPVKIRIREK